MAHSVDVLILCALTEELVALKDAASDAGYKWSALAGVGGVEATLIDSKHGPLRVCAVCPPRMGGQAATSTAASLVERLRPGSLAMCGVCAGHPQDTVLGDVIIADRVFHHLAGKQTKDGFRADFDPRPIPTRWLQAARRLAGPATGRHGFADPDTEDAKWWFLDRLDQGAGRGRHDRCLTAAHEFHRYVGDDHREAFLTELEERLGFVEFDVSTNRFELTPSGQAAVRKRNSKRARTPSSLPFRVHVGPIGSGDSVEGAGDVWTRIEESGVRKVLGVEMEGAAIGHVAFDAELPFAVVKGVMDHANPAKADGYKSFAARASAEILLELLKEVGAPSEAGAERVMRGDAVPNELQPAGNGWRSEPRVASGYSLAPNWRLSVAFEGGRALKFVAEFEKHIGDRIFEVVHLQGESTRRGAAPRVGPRGPLALCDAAVAIVDEGFLNSQSVRDVVAPALLGEALSTRIPVLGVAATSVGSRVLREKFTAVGPLGEAAAHSLVELYWVPPLVGAGATSGGSKPLDQLRPGARSARYDEVLRVLLDHIDSENGGRSAPSGRVPEGSPEDWKRALAEASSELLAWPSRVNGVWIPRPELEELINHLHEQTANGTTQLVVGLPGSGKSALLAELGARWSDGGGVLFGVKADTLPAKLDSHVDLAAFLGLPNEPAELLRGLAGQGEACLVLIDGLDTVASLSERHPGRLTVLTQLITELADYPRVHVVATCRAFEHAHDPRLRGLRARRVELELPTTGDVIEALEKIGVSPPAGLLEILRTPELLRLFVGSSARSTLLGASGPHDLVSAIADRIAPRERTLLTRLACTLGDREEQTLSLAEERNSDFRQLLDDDMPLVEGLRDGGAIRFSHQLIFDFFWVQAAIDRGLVETFVGGTQSTFVRPHLRMVLSVLRSRGASVFHEHVAELWASPALHRHLRDLIVGFVGAVSTLDELDLTWVKGLIRDPDWSSRTLACLVGDRWFEPLVDELELVIQSNDQVVSAAHRLMSEAAATHPGEVLRIVRKHWLSEPRVRQLQFLLRSFDPTFPGVVDTWVESTAFTNCDWHMISGFFGDVEHQESNAARVIGSYVGNRLASVVSLTESKHEGSDRIFAIQRELRKIRIWPGVDLFKGESATFLRAIWPPLRRLIEFGEAGFDRGLRWSVIEAEDSRAGRECLPDVLWDAVADFARCDASGFAAFARSHGAVDLVSVHALVCQGLLTLAQSEPDLAIDLLLEEPGRLSQSGPVMSMRPFLTREVIVAASPAASEGRLEKLATALVAAGMPEADASESTAPQDPQWRNEADIAGLLEAIPTGKTPKGAAEWLAQRTAELPKLTAWVGAKPKMLLAEPVLSPFSSDDFGGMTVSEIVSVFSELSDETGWSHPSKSGMGGSIEASRELAKVLVEDPERAEAIFSKFEPGQQERPVAYAVREWAQTGERALAVRWITWAEQQGFVSFRSELAGALALVANDGGLDENLCTMLRGWLAETSGETPPPRPDDEVSQISRPALEDNGGVVPQGRFTMVQALVFGYLNRDEPSASSALAVVEEYWSVFESPRAFAAFGRHALRALLAADRHAAKETLLRLIDAAPERVLSSAAARHLLGLVPGPQQEVGPFLSIAEFIRMCSWERGVQAHAELMTILTIERGVPDARAFLDELLAAEEPDPRALAGVVHAIPPYLRHLSGADRRLESAIELSVQFLPSVASGPKELREPWLQPLMSAAYAKDSKSKLEGLISMFKALALHPKLLLGARPRILEVASQLVDVAATYSGQVTIGFLSHALGEGRLYALQEKSRDALICVIAALQRRPRNLRQAHEIVDLLLRLRPYQLDEILDRLEGKAGGE